MATEWAAWVQQLKADGKYIEIPSIDRGKGYAFTVTATADVTADAFAGSIRTGPDAAGAALAEFTVSIGAYAGGVTPVTFSLPYTDTDIGDDADFDGVAELVFDIEHTPYGLSAYTCWGGPVNVRGVVQQ